MYRIWDKVKKNYEQTYRIMLDSQDGMYIEGYGDLHEEDMKNLIIEQCTGLKDKNGEGLQEVYEGDIISIDGMIRGNICEMDKGTTDIIIPRIRSQEWHTTYQELMDKGFNYSK